jgi:hypothetical protein
MHPGVYQRVAAQAIDTMIPDEVTRCIASIAAAFNRQRAAIDALRRCLAHAIVWLQDSRHRRRLANAARLLRMYHRAALVVQRSVRKWLLRAALRTRIAQRWARAVLRRFFYNCVGGRGIFRLLRQLQRTRAQQATRIQAMVRGAQYRSFLSKHFSGFKVRSDACAYACVGVAASSAVAVSALVSSSMQL